MHSLASILPDWVFVARPQMLLILLAVIAMAFVIKGADWLVEGAAGIAARLGMPKVIIGATIVSLGTTAPETAVSVLAAFGGNSGLALGNGIGSIIADTGLIFGLGCVLVALPADKFVLSRQGWVQFGSGLLLCVICWGLFAMDGPNATVGRVVGAIFLLLLAGYLAISVRWAKQHGRTLAQTPAESEKQITESTPHPETSEMSTLKLVGIGLIGLVIVIVGGEFLVGSVSELARQWSIPDAVIAGTIVALGTSLPELVVGMTSIRKGHPELLVGNVIGADILNVLFVIGASAVAAPLLVAYDSATQQPTTVIVYVALPAMLAMLLYFRLCIFKAAKDGHFSRWMGYPLLAGYVAYSVVSFWLS